MPKLNKTQAGKVGKAEASDFEPLPNGVYHARLMDVAADRDGQPLEGPKGPYWVWEFDVVEPGDYQNRKLWNNTSLSDDEFPRYKMKESFEAFGREPDADTDELLGGVVKLQVSTRTIQQGARKGELTNQVDKVLPKDEEFEAPEPAEGQPSPDDIFT